MLVMPTVDDVVAAYNKIERAWEDYRKTLRECLAEGKAEGVQGRQKEIARRLGRTREAIRQDALSGEDRERLRRAEAVRRRSRGRSG